MSTSVTLDVSCRRPFADGIAFGEIGAFERLDGVARFTIDPNAPGDVHIVDLDKAPRNADGLVEYSADFSIIKPEEMSKANGRIFFDYGNRGNMRAINFLTTHPHRTIRLQRRMQAMVILCDAGMSWRIALGRAIFGPATDA